MGNKERVSFRSTAGIRHRCKTDCCLKNRQVVGQDHFFRKRQDIRWVFDTGTERTSGGTPNTRPGKTLAKTPNTGTDRTSVDPWNRNRQGLSWVEKDMGCWGAESLSHWSAEKTSSWAAVRTRYKVEGHFFHPCATQGVINLLCSRLAVQHGNPFLHDTYFWFLWGAWLPKCMLT